MLAAPMIGAMSRRGGMQGEMSGFRHAHQQRTDSQRGLSICLCLSPSVPQATAHVMINGWDPTRCTTGKPES